MSNETNPWERKTPLSALVHKENKSEEGQEFEARAEKYRDSAEKVVAGEKLSTLARGFLTGCGGAPGVTPEKCKQFVSDHSKTVRKVFDTVPEGDLPAAVFALVKAVDKDRS